VAATEPQEPMPSWAVRLETKVDLVLSQHSSKLDDHEARIRAQESRVESLRFVSPGQLWSGIVAAIAGSAGLATLINWLTGF
jgi:hypothetical protein